MEYFYYVVVVLIFFLLGIYICLEVYFFCDCCVVLVEMVDCIYVFEFKLDKSVGEVF